MNKTRINPRFESLFAVGVDEMSWDDLGDTRYDWPTVDEIKNYRDQVREVVDNIIINAPLHVNVDWKSPWWAIPMGIGHERIHLETTSVLGANFRLIKGPLEIPFTFRETRRRFQHTNMEVTLWEKIT